jgi:hypothetical protein|tara:strand:+ start:1205 stop:1582 length:378 start_codon:yes stop_codon:yes gene_type:complete
MTEKFSFKPNYQVIVTTTRIGRSLEEVNDERQFVSKSQEAMVHFCQIAIGEEVIVTFLQDANAGRNNFQTQMSLRGKLEYEESRDQYRVLNGVADYCYFKSKDVISATFDGTEETSNDVPVLIIE